MNNQELFDLGWNHFVVNKNAASIEYKDNIPQCVYRGPSESKCAIGIAIPEEVYSRTFEGKGILGLLAFSSSETLQKIFKGTDQEFLRDYQKAHDNSSTYESDDLIQPYKLHTKEDFLKNIEKAFRDIAKTYELTIPK